ncbi:hypothetical protein HPB52_009369 [Rhipicephalus sanguineus]|uniref:Uncharacterized protein n=1 Tax=Rhipicephalus sanguineus TaxID=34632 RepID=A0A9D4PZ18_RHISA|nr:hypothetical protein HPB52_009369 [Rhipicephalus sanguineus]
MVADSATSSGGLFKVQGRGLLNGSCLGAVAEGRIVGEAYLAWFFVGRGLTRVLGSCDLYCWVGRDSDSTALHTVAHPCAVKRASRATCVLAHVDDRIMLARRGPKL